MERNGKIYCDVCCLFIDPRYHVSVRILRSEGDRNNPDDHAHFHARHSADCYYKKAKREAALAPPKKPTPEDLQKYRAFLEARRAT